MNCLFRKIVFISLVITLPQLANAAAKVKSQGSAAFSVKRSIPMKTEDDKFSYILGIDLAENFTRQEVKINPELIYLGLKAALGDEYKDELASEDMQKPETANAV